MNIAALVSGGVDSSVVVPLLKEQGYDPHIFYIKIGMEGKEDLSSCPSEEDIEITTYIAKKYGCKFDIVDLQHEYFETVGKYTMEMVRKGLTPNPDVMCNRWIKLGAFEEKGRPQLRQNRDGTLRPLVGGRKRHLLARHGCRHLQGPDLFLGSHHLRATEQGHLPHRRHS